jgi:hypothetical protein
MQLFGTSFNLYLGGLRLQLSFAIDDRVTDPAVTRVEDMPRFELPTIPRE